MLGPAVVLGLRMKAAVLEVEPRDEPETGVGTRIDVEFQLSHIDRMPLGNIGETFLTLVVGCPDVNWQLNYTCDQDAFEFNDADFKKELEGIALTDPAVLGYLRGYIAQGISEAQTSTQML